MYLEEGEIEGSAADFGADGGDYEFRGQTPEDDRILVPSSSNHAPASLFNRVLSEEAGHYRKIQTMFRFYRICSALGVNDPDRLYGMFLRRLGTRRRLESLSSSLEQVVAALFYIDQRNSTANNLTLRDVLARIPGRGAGLKKFSATVSKVARELGVPGLAPTSRGAVVANMLDQLRTFCLQKARGGGADPLRATSTTVVLLRMDEGDLGSMLQATPESAPSDDGAEPGRARRRRAGREGASHRLLYLLLSSNRERIESLALLILGLVGGSGLSEDVLDPGVRGAFSCRKTLFSSAILLASLALRIPLTARLVYTAMDVHRSSFYRTHRNLLLRLSSALKVPSSLKVTSALKVPSALKLPSAFKGNVKPEGRDGKNLPELLVALQRLSDTPNPERRVEDQVSSLKLAPNSEPNPNDGTSVDTSKAVAGSLTFNKALKCLDILTGADSTSDENYAPAKGKAGSAESERLPEGSESHARIYLVKNRNYTCRYYSNGRIRSKSFSLSYYGDELALRLANEFRSSLLNP